MWEIRHILKGKLVKSLKRLLFIERKMGGEGGREINLEQKQNRTSKKSWWYRSEAESLMGDILGQAKDDNDAAELFSGSFSNGT